MNTVPKVRNELIVARMEDLASQVLFPLNVSHPHRSSLLLASLPVSNGAWIPSSSPIPPTLHLDLSQVGGDINVGILGVHSHLCVESNALGIVRLDVPGGSVAGSNARPPLSPLCHKVWLEEYLQIHM
jgi:hypothetical protein